MRISVKYAIWLLALMPLAQGCDQKKPKAQTQTQTLAPPIIDIPPTQPSTVSKADLPPPVIGDTEPKPAANDAANKPPEPAKKPVHHPKKPAPAASGTQEAANANPAPAVSAIGQLSGGASGDLRTTTEETINSTEKGVNGITRTLNDTEVKTAAQIHEFLKEAREALTTGDVDGAHTLANKAKVLLTELNQQ
jgi:hypothetical protein